MSSRRVTIFKLIYRITSDPVVGNLLNALLINFMTDLWFIFVTIFIGIHVRANIMSLELTRCTEKCGLRKTGVTGRGEGNEEVVGDGKEEREAKRGMLTCGTVGRQKESKK